MIFDVFKKCFRELSNSLKSIELSLFPGIFLEKLKISKITPIFKANQATLVEIYIRISLLTGFQKY